MEYWKFINTDKTISTVESHSYPHIVPDAIPITKEEYDEYITSLPKPQPQRELMNFGAEINALKGRVLSLEKR